MQKADDVCVCLCVRIAHWGEKRERRATKTMNARNGEGGEIKTLKKKTLTLAK